MVSKNDLLVNCFLCLAIYRCHFLSYSFIKCLSHISIVKATLTHFCKRYINKGYYFMTEGLSLLFITSPVFYLLPFCCGLKKNFFFHWLWQSFCSRHGDLNSILTEGCLLFLFSVFSSLPSPLVMGESCSKGAYLNLYNGRTH